MLLCVFDPRLSYWTLLLMVECADCKLVSLGFNSLSVLFRSRVLFYLGFFIFFFDSNISLSRSTTDCCVIGNVSTLGVGIWGFKSLQSDRFFIYFSLFRVLSFLLFFIMPQLVPFYFLNLLTFGIIAIAVLLYVVSTIILPNILRLLVARILIAKL